MNDIEKQIIAKLKEFHFEKDDIIPTMLLIKDNEEYQKKILEFLNSVNNLTNEELLDQIEKLGILENNPNIE